MQTFFDIEYLKKKISLVSRILVPPFYMAGEPLNFFAASAFFSQTAPDFFFKAAPTPDIFFQAVLASTSAHCRPRLLTIGQVCKNIFSKQTPYVNLQKNTKKVRLFLKPIQSSYFS